MKLWFYKLKMSKYLYIICYNLMITVEMAKCSVNPFLCLLGTKLHYTSQPACWLGGATWLVLANSMGVDRLQACAQSLLWDPRLRFHQPNIEDTGALVKNGTSRWMEPGPMWKHVADSLKCVLDLKAGKEMNFYCVQPLWFGDGLTHKVSPPWWRE